MAIDQDLLEDAVHHTIGDTSGVSLQSLLVRDDEDFLIEPELAKFEPLRPREPRTELLRRVQLGIEDEIDKWVHLEKPCYPSLIKVHFCMYMVGLVRLPQPSSQSMCSLHVSANFVTKGTDHCPNSGSTTCAIEVSRVTKLFFSGRTV